MSPHYAVIKYFVLTDCMGTSHCKMHNSVDFSDSGSVERIKGDFVSVMLRFFYANVVEGPGYVYQMASAVKGTFPVNSRRWSGKPAAAVFDRCIRPKSSSLRNFIPGADIGPEEWLLVQ